MFKSQSIKIKALVNTAEAPGEAFLEDQARLLLLIFLSETVEVHTMAVLHRCVHFLV
jgi:hypothetical protein